jgi:hypothetical protein
MSNKRNPPSRPNHGDGMTNSHHPTERPPGSNGNPPFHITSISFRMADLRSISGWDLNHPYVETFWLPVIGPTSTLMLRYIGRQDRTLEYTTFDSSELATCLGLGGGSTGRNGSVARTVKRLTQFGLASIDSTNDTTDMLVTVVPQVPIVRESLRTRWPEDLRILHSRAIARQHLEVAKERAS